MMDNQELLSTIALTRVYGLGNIGARTLMNSVGSAVDIFRYRRDLKEMVPGVQTRLVNALDDKEIFRRAECEMKFAEENSIRCIALNDEEYPSRLRECEDAPLVLYYKGKANLNALRIVSVVGTRMATQYGKDLCDNLVREISALCPDVLIVSGLAYGIDIQSHRAALTYGLDTIAVLAHGLDRIYPQAHRNTAIQMLNSGGLLTEFMSDTEPDRQNFVKRNRIVAGLADAVIVVESAIKGGALITADLAQGYNRECFAFPGRIDDEFSRGCNNLIRDNKAALITSGEDFVKAMNWTVSSRQPEAVQRQLFVELTDEQNRVMEVLNRFKKGIQINALIIETDIPINRLSPILFELELKGLVKPLVGGMYRVV